MDLSTVLGLAAGIGVMVLAIVAKGEALSAFNDAAAWLIVLGGSVAALLVSVPLARVLGMTKVLRKAVFQKRADPEGLIREIMGYAEIARRDGILSLDERTSRMTDDFLARGMQMAVDGADPETIEEVLNSELDALGQRHKQGRKIFEILAKYSPAFGLIGTLIGLVMMLHHMDDASRIGEGMAIALLTTLYGALGANLVFGPIAEKLGTRSQEEILAKEIALRGVLSIQSGDNPRMVEQKLRSFLPATTRRERKVERKRTARAA
jgi:chemotaxis protein MotA